MSNHALVESRVPDYSDPLRRSVLNQRESTLKMLKLAEWNHLVGPDPIETESTQLEKDDSRVEQVDCD